ncbi:uncharacterized protein LOC143603208 [Bidens hawaiensis]|uniref:uncharacterized protein LOC143603208 n=1 Tax=Bidens hawaiensis TaxID=980011 RepID=UPI004049BD1A
MRQLSFYSGSLYWLRIKRIKESGASEVNGTEFYNKVVNEFCHNKGILRQFSAPYTPEKNGVAERRNHTLVEAARTMLSYSKLPLFFWGEAINAACFTQNRVLLNKRLNKTPYEVFYGTKPRVNFFRTIGCPCTVLQTNAGSTSKFAEKADECYFFQGMYVTPVAPPVFRVVPAPVQPEDDQSILMQAVVRGLEDVNVAAPVPVLNAPPVANQSAAVNEVQPTADTTEMPTVEDTTDSDTDSCMSADNVEHDQTDHANEVTQYVASGNTDATSIPAIFVPFYDNLWEGPIAQEHLVDQEEGAIDPQPNAPVNVSTVFHPIESLSIELEATPVKHVEQIPQLPIHRRRLTENIIGDPLAGIQTRSTSGNINKCLFACFISQVEPKDYKVALKENSWVEAMQEELLQFKKLNVWRLARKPEHKKPIGTKWVFRNKKDDKGLSSETKPGLLYKAFGNVRDMIMMRFMHP